MSKMVLGKKPVSFLKATMTFAVALSFFVPSLPVVGAETFDDTTASISPYAQAVNKGETFNVSIRVKPGETIMGINVGRLSFDPSLLHLNSVTEGGIFDPYDTFISGIVNNTNGTVNGIYGSTFLSNATANPGAFCNISFTSQEKIGTSILDLDNVVVTNISGVEVPVIMNDGDVAVGWSVTLDFNEDSGNYDYVVFGEVSTANDGEPHDSYDTPKSPPPIEPYIRAWFKDNLSTPYNLLLKDYRQYPDAEKTWDLYAIWKCSSSTPTNITISWNASEFIGCEYNSVVLWRYDPSDEGWDFAANMIIEEEFTYAPHWFGVQWLTDHFQINATMDITPPEITNVTRTSSDPIDTDPFFGWENFTGIINDFIAMGPVKLVVTDPDAPFGTIEYSMINIPDTDIYYYNTTLTGAGDYTYHIWADDTSGNRANSTPETFVLPENWEMNDDRICDISDLRMVSLQFGETGLAGWIREDYSNDGICDISDLRMVALHFSETY